MIIKKNKKLLGDISCILIIGILVVLMFLLHDHIVFMMDDEWYSTNLATGEVLTGLSDVIESQKWHYYQWGGRSITHGILQLTLMSGDLCANILNVLMTIALAYLICVISGKCSLFNFALAGSLMIALNPNIKTSMFWQAGVVNYVYSTAWILLFLWIYIRTIRSVKNVRFKNGVKYQNDAGVMVGAGGRISGVCMCLLMAVLGLITGWSNENMGPASCIFAVVIILYRKFFLKKSSPLWMYLGALFSFAGSVFCILAPGNFVRSAEIESMGLVQTVFERFIMMLQAGTDFLLPALILCVVLGLIFMRYSNATFKIEYIMMFGMAVLAFGAMILSPHFPDRATFGIMCLLIIVIVYLLQELMERFAAFKKVGFLLLICSFGYSVFEICNIILLQ